MPHGTASPWGFVAASTSRHVQPPPTRTVREPGSTETEFSSERSMRTPPSTLPSPAPLCPPPRTATGRLSERANAIAFATSPPLPQRTIRAGRLSIMALKSARASS